MKMSLCYNQTSKNPYWDLNANQSYISLSTKKSTKSDILYFVVGMFLTLLKFPLIFFLVSNLLSNTNPVNSIRIICAIMILDILDGEIFQLSIYAKTKFGALRRAIDAIGDRLAIGSVFIILFFQYNLPSYMFLIVIIKELFLSQITIKKLLNKKIVLKANPFSKLSTVLIGVSAILYLSNYNFISSLCLVIMIPFLILGYISYKKID